MGVLYKTYINKPQNHDHKLADAYFRQLQVIGRTPGLGWEFSTTDTALQSITKASIHANPEDVDSYTERLDAANTADKAAINKPLATQPMPDAEQTFALPQIRQILRQKKEAEERIAQEMER
ncbi:hypothetical protein LTR36_006767 [Oleoguttula mirabilis]|uniref:Uncharacterized protein n=1 Tax=Oleoguttula mirabilis TaxID=1507867 RepID=A0AAV9JCJ9_9PEZI|nr:hypothetical protein LTR36_006767 [Oleoguttula mirabilis]